MDGEGAIVGEHDGVAGYTIGQRKGLGAFGNKRFVTSIDPGLNVITIGDEEELLATSLVTEAPSWVGGAPPSSEFEAEVKVRYKSPPVPARVNVDGDALNVEFSRPQRAVTPGQLRARGDGLLLLSPVEDPAYVAELRIFNPDGAEVFQRENAVGIDVNRDARRLSTPEATTLKRVHDSFKPEFGFNLHDQNARTRVGSRGVQSAIALLAPAYDSLLSYNDVRTRARLVAAALATTFAHEITGRIAKYDDAFNPRAFGDLMQQWGTSTVLIESGALPDDPEKQRLRAIMDSVVSPLT